MPVPTAWHPGELAAQQARGFEDDVWGMWDMYQEGAPDWMELFLSQLPFLSVTTLDGQGRPWASLITNDGKPGFIEAVPGSSGENVLRFTIKAQEGNAIGETLVRLHNDLASGTTAYKDGEPRAEFQMAAVGVMLHNRRRNKLEGVIVDVSQVPQNDGDDIFVFDFAATSTFGNCPKYINTRFLIPSKGESPAGSGKSGKRPTRGSNDLPVEVLKAIQSTDLLFLASKYSGNDPSSYMPDPARLGNNHRGGPPGFLRTYFDEDAGGQRCIVLPDWSGNRLMMSFGNMSKDPVAGIAIPVWSMDPTKPSGVLSMTCRAQVLAGEEARQLMRGVQGAAKLWIEDWTWLPGALPVFVAGTPDGNLVGYSPYNPPVRQLKTENAIEANIGSTSRPNAKIVDARIFSDEIARLTFEVPQGTPIFESYKPGKHVVIDGYELLDTRIQMYQHMAGHRGGEKDLNDDGVRSWTLTYAAPVIASEDDAWHFEVTLRRKNRGGVTPGIFRIGANVRQNLDESNGQDIGGGWRPPVPVLGIDGEAILPDREATPTAPLRLLYLVSGIGLTPMLAHLSQLKQRAVVTAIVATRRDEAAVTERLIADALLRLGAIKVHMKLFLLVSSRSADGDGSGASAQEVDWTAMPANIDVDVVQSHGKRLVDSSLTSNSKAEDAFILPEQAASLLQPSEESGSLDMALVCAASAFSRTAREALDAAGIKPNTLHFESFSF